jgi:hypothetical protein
MSTTTAPAHVAARLDALHAQLRVEVDNLCHVADAALNIGDTATARDCLSAIAERRARICRIEACWVQRP